MRDSLYIFTGISKISLVFLTTVIFSFALGAERRKLPKFGKSPRYTFFREAQNLARKNYEQKNFKGALDNLKTAMRYSSKSSQKYWVFSMQFNTLMQMKDYGGLLQLQKKVAGHPL